MVRTTLTESQIDECVSRHSSESVTSQKSQEICVICLESISERAIAVPCNHCSFDFICLASWIQDHASCPLCKATLTAVEYDWRAPDDYKTFQVPSQPPPASNGLNASASWRRPLRGRVGSRRGRYPEHSYLRSLRETPDQAISQRRHIYRHQLYSLHVGSNRISRFKDFTPSAFSRSSDLQSRARTWIRRELQVFDFLSPSRATPAVSATRSNNTEFVLSYIISVLKTVDIKSSTGQAEELLAGFLGEGNARLFLHELEAWLRSPYTRIEDWDRRMQYREAGSRAEVDTSLEELEECVERGNDCAAMRRSPRHHVYDADERHANLMRSHYEPD